MNKPLFTSDGEMVSSPSLVVFEPTNCCNQKCSKCLRSYSSMRRQQGMLKLADFQTMIGKIPPSVEFIGLNGFGEPLLHPDFCSLLGITLNHNPAFKIGFHTNGVLLSDKIIDSCLEFKVRDIEISIDATDEITYQTLHRGNNSFAKVLENVEKLVRRKNEARSSLRVGVSYVVQEENKGDLIDFVLLAERLGVDFIGPVVPVNPLLGYKLQKNSFMSIKKEIEEAAEFSRSHGLQMIYPTLKRDKIGSANIDPIKETSCAFPFTLYPIITWDGYAMPCVWIQDLGYNTGNLIHDGFNEIWNGERIKSIRRGFLEGKYLPLCDNCKPGGLEANL